MRRLPASTAALGILSSPVIGVITAMIVLGERPTWYDAIGFALMLSASAIVVLRPDGATRGRAIDPRSVKEHECVHAVFESKARLTGRDFLPLWFETAWSEPH